ncbi:MAG: tRNA guanosine(34) transglycosylase Tgt [Planctomycetota bacterium]|nr:tRNA guanosine(34) transglycosylase Tgt [Planctomycetota bacterium]
MRFTVTAVCGAARAGVLETAHGVVNTPAFMPVGTLGPVKGVMPEMLRRLGAEMLLANTYHLALRPGAEVVRQLGGVARFTGWRGPTLTDSGGYQVFSLAPKRRISDVGVFFQSHLDGAAFDLTPERAIAIQQDLGADVMMVLDQCPPANADRQSVAQAVARTFVWARRCREAWTQRQAQSLFGIVQGGVFEDLRRESAQQICELDFPGNAIGGVAVGESEEDMQRIVAFTAPLLPPNKPRYLMGVGRPQDILMAIGCGIDMFDCVMPSRHARHGEVFTSTGTLDLRHSAWRTYEGPIAEDCDCPACRSVSRAYLRHLFVVGEMLGPIYATLHNLRFYLRLVAEARAAIIAGHYAVYCREFLLRLAQ